MSSGAWGSLISNYGYNRNSRSYWYLICIFLDRKLLEYKNMDCHWIVHCTARSTGKNEDESSAQVQQRL
jgi:hypothetical protein